VFFFNVSHPAFYLSIYLSNIFFMGQKGVKEKNRAYP